MIGSSGVRRKIDNRMKRFVFWAFSQEMSQGAIADQLNISKSSVHALIKQARENTDILIHVGVVIWVYEPDVDSAEVWMCRFCGDKYDKLAGAAIDAYEHLFILPNGVYRPRQRKVDRINRTQ